MHFLLDTHFLIWAMFDSKSLPDDVRTIIEGEDSYVEYSVISLWETEIKHMKHPNEFEFTSDEIYEYAQAEGYHLLELKQPHISMLKNLQEPVKKHKDPFDKMLIAQAKHENIYFLTHDKRLVDYGEECVQYF